MLSNAEIKKLSELREKSGRKEQKLFFIEGKRAVIEALTGTAAIKQIILSLAAGETRMAEIRDLASDKGIEVEELPETKFRKLSSTESSQGVLAVAHMRETTLEGLISEIRPKRNATIVLLDRISDPGNLGTILRSAAWFGVDGICVSAGSVDAYNPKVVRSAMSAIAELEVVQEVALTEVIASLKRLGFVVVGAAQDTGTSYSDFDYPGRCAVLFGSEASGIPHDLLDACTKTVSIPRVGKMESLNVGVAASIILSEMARRNSPGGLHS